MTLFQRLNNLYRNNKKQVIAAVIVILLSGTFFTMRNKNPDKIVEWHDDVAGWIILQECKGYYIKPKVSDLPDIKKLELDAELIRSIKDLRYFHNLEELTLNVKNIKNLDTLQHLKKLDKLIIINGDIKTLKNISKLNVSTLELRNFTLPDVKLLTEMPSLSSLEITDSYIEDGRSIKDLSGLSYLLLANVETQNPISLCESGNYNQLHLINVDISNLGIVSLCKKLTSLKLEGINLMEHEDVIFPVSVQKMTVKNCGLTNFDMFLSLPNLESLDISDNKLEDINNVEKFHELKELSLVNNPIADLKQIGKLKKCIKLNISGISLSKETLSVLSKMKMEVLLLSGCGISDLNFLKGHTEIKKLDLSNNEIEDIEVLRMYREDLSYLNISGNPINDLSPLKEWVPSTLFYDEKYYYFEGVELDVSDINLGEIDAEKGVDVIANMILSKLTARNCGLETTLLVAPHTKLQYLDVSGNPIEDYMWTDLECLKDVIAKDTLLTEENCKFQFQQLAPKGIYGSPAFLKIRKSNFFTNKCKKVWIRITIE